MSIVPRASYAKILRRQILAHLELHGPMTVAALIENIERPPGCPAPAIKTALNYLKGRKRATFTLNGQRWHVPGDDRVREVAPPGSRAPARTEKPPRKTTVARRRPAAPDPEIAEPSFVVEKIDVVPATLPAETTKQPEEAREATEPEQPAGRPYWMESTIETRDGMTISVTMHLSPAHLAELGPDRIGEITHAAAMLLSLQGEVFEREHPDA